jgi:hypothetical protein
LHGINETSKSVNSDVCDKLRFICKPHDISGLSCAERNRADTNLAPEFWYDAIEIQHFMIAMRPGEFDCVLLTPEFSDL